jgi:hypothetical protein
MSGAETLRQAARLMRERAEAATDSPWVVKRARPDMPAYVAHEGWWVIASRTEQWDAEHIASWHPAVALAVADWLDATAAEHESDSGNERADAFFAAFNTAPDIAALAVARAYLGEQP